MIPTIEKIDRLAPPSPRPPPANAGGGEESVFSRIGMSMGVDEWGYAVKKDCYTPFT